MYSLILMTAMAGGAEAPANGGPVFPRFRATVSAAFAPVGTYRTGYYGCGSSCFGCGGSCFGCVGSCTGCFGSCFGCFGSCSGCYGSCTGSAYFGCYGSCYGSAVWGGCYGTLAGGSCIGYMPVYGEALVPAVTVPVVPETPAQPAPAQPETKRSSFKPAAPQPALLTVRLPAGATLHVDGQTVTGDGDVRRFHTPELPAGQAFFYELKAMVMVNGQPEPEELTVVVRAGDEREITFERLIAAVKAAESTVVRK